MDAGSSFGLRNQQRTILVLLVQTEEADASASKKINKARKVAAFFAFEFVKRFEEQLGRYV